jgi:GxxExxY protein
LLYLQKKSCNRKVRREFREDREGPANRLHVFARDLTPQIIGAAIKIHRLLGPGLLESAYEACLAYEIEKLGLRVERQRPVPLFYESVKLDCGFRADLVVEGRVVVETKCKEALHPVDEAQLLSHLRLLNIPVGLLINFHVVLLKNGIRRMVNHYREEPTVEDKSF